MNIIGPHLYKFNLNVKINNYIIAHLTKIIILDEIGL